MERRVGFTFGYASGLQPRDVIVRDDQDDAEQALRDVLEAAFEDVNVDAAAGSGAYIHAVRAELEVAARDAMRRVVEGHSADLADVIHRAGRMPRINVNTSGSGIVEVIGLSVDEVTEAVRLLSQARQVASELSASVRAQLLATLMSASQPAISPAEVTASQGLATLRARLLETPYETYESLAKRRGATTNATRTAIKRARDGGAVFTVPHGGRALLPTFQFDESGNVREASQSVVSTLRNVGLDGWQLWEWFASPTGWLDDDVPSELLDFEPDVVLAAARQYAEELAVGRRSAEAAGQVSAAES